MIVRKCTVCGKKVPQYTKCACEIQKRLDNYKDYQKRRVLYEDEKERVDFYQSKEWELCRATVARHQFNLDLLEWSKGNIVQAEVYHHVIEVKESKDVWLDIYNIMGLTQSNHNKLHAQMNQSTRKKKAIQAELMSILHRFEEEFY
ncbi:MAG: endonuclease domain protein [Herbinix sp.]|nr:endonuclease domain protein [Herbinix sp.]